MRQSLIGACLPIAALLAPIYLAACAISPPPPSLSSERGVESGSVTRALYDQLARWRGTRYRMGGMGDGGIDCSGLTYVVYRDVFGTHLPRTTTEQGRVGYSVGRRKLAPGDLVFFKTGMFQRHVGIYIEDGQFMHASKSGGVRMSSLSDSYWRKRYWKARRVSAI